MSTDNIPKTYDSLFAQLSASAKHGAWMLETMIRRFNNWRETEAKRALLREAEKAEYVRARAVDLEEEERAAQRRRWEAQAAAEYDATRPPIHVPPYVDLALAKQIAANATSKAKAS
jgi:hypothetical protein